MKKVLVLTLSAGLASAVVTSAVNASYLDNVGVYGSGTYTRPSNNGLSIGEIQTVNPALEFYPYDRAVFLSPEFSWDYALGVSFRFPCTDTRLYAEYDYFNDTDHRVVSGLAKYDVFPIDPSNQNAVGSLAHANVMETSREWRLGVRHFVHFGPRFMVDLSSFFEYDRINISLHQWDVANNTAGSGDGRVLEHITGYYENNSKFAGWGPGAGLKLIGVPMACCPTVTLFGGVATTLFYAKNTYNSYMYQEDIAPSRRFNQGFVYEKNPEFSQSLLTKIDINFGVDYHRMLCLAGEQLRSGVTVGVRYMNIFNAFKNGNSAGNAIVPNTTNQPAVFLPVSGIPNDWGRVGPYVQFRVGGCDA